MSNGRGQADTRALEIAAEAKGAVTAMTAAVTANAEAVKELTRRIEAGTALNSREHRENAARVQQMEQRLLDRIDALARDLYVAVEKVEARRSEGDKDLHRRIDNLLALALKALLGAGVALMLGIGGWALLTLVELS